MTSTPPNSICEENLAESWVELHYAGSNSTASPPLLAASQIEKLLLEAQRESNQSSLKNSGYCSPRTPKSLASSHSVQDELLTSLQPQRDDGDAVAEWLWDWSGPRPESSISIRDMKYGASSATGGGAKVNLSLRHSRVIRKGVMGEILPVFVVSNILSIILGAGIGMFFGRRWSGARASLSAFGID